MSSSENATKSGGETIGMWKWAGIASLVLVGAIGSVGNWGEKQLEGSDVLESSLASTNQHLRAPSSPSERSLQANRTRSLEANRPISRLLQADNSSRFLQENSTRLLQEDGNATRLLQHGGNRVLTEDVIGKELFDLIHPEVIDSSLPSPCRRVDPNMPNDEVWRRQCQNYLNEAHIIPDCSEAEELVPRIYHSVSRDKTQSYHQMATTAQNPTFERHHVGDEEAAQFISENCGSEALEAYNCFAPPAYRADLFRFCALYSQGGVYLDADIMPFVPLEKIYSPCSVATVGHDFPWSNKKGKQMKILASAPKAPIFQCAIETIVNNVKARYYPETELELTGPQMLHKCYEAHSENVAITYHDTRNAEWPYTGMRANHDILAFEIPMSEKHFVLEGGKDASDYTDLFKQHKVYKESCRL